MMKMFISDAIVSRGYDGAPAIRFFSSENSGGEFAVFQIGKRKYDSRAENNHRWVNLKVKAFGDACERIKKMKLKEGSSINLVADYDEECWKDKESGEERSSPALTLSGANDIKFSHAGGQKKEQNGGAQGGSGQEPGYPPAGSQGQGYPPAGVQGQGYPPAGAQAGPQGQGYPPAGQTMPPAGTAPVQQGFTGYESFSGTTTNPYFPG